MWGLSLVVSLSLLLMEGLYENHNDISLARWIKMEQMTGLWPRLYCKFCPPFSHSSRSQSFSHVRCKSLWIDVPYNQSDFVEMFKQNIFSNTISNLQ